MPLPNLCSLFRSHDTIDFAWLLLLFRPRLLTKFSNSHTNPLILLDKRAVSLVLGYIHILLNLEPIVQFAFIFSQREWLQAGVFSVRRKRCIMKYEHYHLLSHSRYRFVSTPSTDRPVSGRGLMVGVQNFIFVAFLPSALHLHLRHLYSCNLDLFFSDLVQAANPSSPVTSTLFFCLKNCNLLCSRSGRGKDCRSVPVSEFPAASNVARRVPMARQEATPMGNERAVLLLRRGVKREVKRGEGVSLQLRLRSTTSQSKPDRPALGGESQSFQRKTKPKQIGLRSGERANLPTKTKTKHSVCTLSS